MRRTAALIGCVFGLGCAYYNGLYNANRLATEARKAEREGRPGDARSLWERAAVKAESVAVHYPQSRYHDDALLLWGRALKNAGRCSAAVPPLRSAVDSSADSIVQRDARLGLGECWVTLDRPDSAIVALSPLVTVPSLPVRQAALLARGRAALRRGDLDGAIADLEWADSSAAAFDLATAHVLRGDLASGKAVLADRVRGPFDEVEWARVLDTLGARNPDGASALVDALLERGGLTAGQRARLALGDAERWTADGDAGHAQARYSEALSAAPDSAAGAIAGLRLLQLRASLARDVDSLGALAEAFREIAAAGGPAARAAEPYAAVLGSGAQLLAEPPSEDGDLRLFVIAELARDSVDLEGLAGALFLHIAGAYPMSCVAPKALLAAAALRAAPTDSVREALLQRYPASPYTGAIVGETGLRLEALEDSLGVLLTRLRGAWRAWGRGPGDTRPSDGRNRGRR